MYCFYVAVSYKLSLTSLPIMRCCCIELNTVAFMFVTLEDKTMYEERDGQNDEKC